MKGVMDDMSEYVETTFHWVSNLFPALSIASNIFLTCWCGAIGEHLLSNVQKVFYVIFSSHRFGCSVPTALQWAPLSFTLNKPGTRMEYGEPERSEDKIPHFRTWNFARTHPWKFWIPRSHFCLAFATPANKKPDHVRARHQLVVKSWWRIIVCDK